MRESPRNALEVVNTSMLGHIHLRRVDGHRDLVGLRIEFGQHMARVIAKPFGALALFRREADRASHLDDHFRTGLAHAGDQLIELGQALAALAVLFAHVQMQHSRTGFVAIHRLLDLIRHGDRDIFRKI
ncbi:hypothetical protein D9M72_224410 [compost metagenome]